MTLSDAAGLLAHGLAAVRTVVEAVQAAVPAAIQAAVPDAGGFVAGEAAARPDQVARGLRFLNAAYTAVWVILAAYLLLLSVRQRRLERQMQRLRQRLGLDPSPTGGKPTS